MKKRKQWLIARGDQKAAAVIGVVGGLVVLACVCYLVFGDTIKARSEARVAARLAEVEAARIVVAEEAARREEQRIEAAEREAVMGPIRRGRAAEQRRQEAKEQQQRQAETPGKPAIEYQLAVIDEGYVDPQATVVNRYRYLTAGLALRCSTTRVDIGDKAVAARNRLRDTYGQDVKVLALLETADNIPADLQTYGDDKAAILFTLVIQVYK